MSGALSPRPDPLLRRATLALYALGLVALVLALGLFRRSHADPPSVHPLIRGLQRGEAAPSVPRLDPDDAMANAAVLGAALQEVPHPGVDGPVRCRAKARHFAVMIEGKLSRIRLDARAVCQLLRLKHISVSQPGLGESAVAEIAAFLVGRRLGDDVDVTRVVVPPFHYSGDTLTFHAARLAALQPGERFIGTYHTHPGGDLDQGVLSETDIAWMETGYVDFAGAVGSLSQPSEQLDWLFDIVDPRTGDWNVYAHDRGLLREMGERCRTGPGCPLNELRLGGSRFNLVARCYEEKDEDLP